MTAILALFRDFFRRKATRKPTIPEEGTYCVFTPRTGQVAKVYAALIREVEMAHAGAVVNEARCGVIRAHMQALFFQALASGELPEAFTVLIEHQDGRCEERPAKIDATVINSLRVVMRPDGAGLNVYMTPAVDWS